MKKFLLIALAAIAINANAQTGFGIQAGALISNLTVKDGSTSQKTDNMAGFKAGFFAEMPLMYNLYFNPELNFVYKGGKASDSEGTYAFKLNYLELPLNIEYKVESGMGNMFFGAGPVISYGLFGKLGINGTDVDIKFDGNSGITSSGNTDTYAHLKPLEVGANIFLGYELPAGVRFSVQARPNFTNSLVTGSATMKNFYAGLNIGYRFR